MALRGIFGHKKDEVVGEQRKLHNEELHNLHSSSNIITGHHIMGDEMDGACSMRGRDEICIQNFS